MTECTVNEKQKRYKILDNVPELQDPGVISADELSRILRGLIRKHGKRVCLHFSAGFNNITVQAVVPSRRGVGLE